MEKNNEDLLRSSFENDKNYKYINTFCPHLLNHHYNNFINNKLDSLIYNANSSENQNQSKFIQRNIFYTNTYPKYYSPVIFNKSERYTTMENTSNSLFLSNIGIESIFIPKGRNLENSPVNREGCVFVVSFDDNAEYMAISNHSFIHNIDIWDFKQKKVIKTINVHKEIATGVQFFHGNKDMFLTCSLDKTIKLWKNFNNVHTFLEHSDWVRCVCINQSNTKFLSGCVSSVVKLWDLPTRRVISTMPNTTSCNDTLNTINTLLFLNRNENLFIAGYRNGEVKIFDTRIKCSVKGASESLISTGISQQFYAHSSKMNSVKLNLTENYLMTSGRESMLCLWDMRKLPSGQNVLKNYKNCIQRYTKHKCKGYNIDANFFCKDKYLITGSEDSFIYIYDIISGEVAYKIPFRYNCINIVKPIPKTYCSFACTGLEELSVFIMGPKKNLSKIADQRNEEKKGKNEGKTKALGQNVNNSNNIFDQTDTFQEHYMTILEQIMTEYGDDILRIFHTRNLPYSSGTSFENFYEILRNGGDQESVKIANDIYQKILKSLLTCFSNKNSNDTENENKKENNEKEDNIKIEIKNKNIVCSGCKRENIHLIEKRIESKLNQFLLRFENRLNFNEKKDNINKDDEKEGKEINEKNI